MKPRKRIIPISKRKRALNGLYMIVRSGFLAEHKYCAVFPARRAFQVHHIRGRLGPLLIDTRFFLAVSMQGHAWINDNPKKARVLGFLAQPGEWHTPPKDEITARLREEISAATSSPKGGGK